MHNSNGIINTLIQLNLRYLITFLMCLNSAICEAQIINFNFLDLIDQSLSDTLTADDGETTLTVSTTDIWGNQGIAGIMADTDGLKVYKNSLSLFFEFSKDVTLKSFFHDYSYQIDDHIIEFSLGNETKNLELTSNNYSTEEFPATFDNWVIPANTSLKLTSLDNNVLASQQWASLTVTVVPEPATYALLLGCGVLGVRLLIRRLAKNTD